MSPELTEVLEVLENTQDVEIIDVDVLYSDEYLVEASIDLELRRADRGAEEVLEA